MSGDNEWRSCCLAVANQHRQRFIVWELDGEEKVEKLGIRTRENAWLGGSLVRNRIDGGLAQVKYY